MGGVNTANVHDVVAHHAPTDAEIERIQLVRNATEDFIRAILTHAPDCADRSAAVRHARDAMMTANAAIVLKGAV